MDLENQVLLGDNQLVLHGLADNSVDLTLCSPPYHLTRAYNGLGSGSEASLDAYFDALEYVFDQCVRVTKPTGTVIFNLGDQWRSGGQILLPYRFAIRVIDRFEVTLVNDVTWHKPNPNPFFEKDHNRRRLTNCQEQFLVFAKGKDYYFDPQPFRDDKPARRLAALDRLREGYRKCFASSSLNEHEKRNGLNQLESLVKQVGDGTIDGFRISVRGVHSMPQRHRTDGPTRDMMNKGYHVEVLHGVPLAKNMVSCPIDCRSGVDHPAVFPIELIRKFIIGFCETRGLVFDPYMGSGTTAKAALQTDRKYLGIEIDRKYFEDSVLDLNSFRWRE